MAKRPGIVRHGTARDDADNAPGYVASGSSEHTRHAAHGGKVEEKAEPDHIKGRFIDARRSVADLIYENRRELRKLAAKIENERDPVRIERFRKSAAIKSRFLASLLDR